MLARNVHGLLGLAAAAALLLASACGGAGASTRDDGMASGSGSSGTSAAQGRAAGTPKAAAKRAQPSGKRLTDDDFKVRLVQEVKAPTYLPDIDRKAQDEFRIGIAAALAKPPRYKLAVKQFESAVDKDPKFLEAWFNLGQTLERMGRADQALEIYQGALAANPDNVSANAYIAKIYLGKGRGEALLGNAAGSAEWYSKSKGILDGLVAKAPEDTAVNNAMALYFLAQDDLETAERYVKEVLYVEPTNVTGLNTRGLINLRHGKLLIAEWIFKNKVLAEDPNSTEALTNLGFTYIQLNNRPLAMKYFKEALERDADNMEVRMNIAAMLLEHLNYQEAYDHYTRVLAAQPLNLEAHEGQCDAAFGLGGSASDPALQFQASIDCYVEYIGKVPSRADLYRRIAETYQQKLQDLDGAVKYYELYSSKATIDAAEKKKIAGIVKVLKDIIAKGGLKAMMAPEEGEEGEFEEMDDEGFEEMDDEDGGDGAVDAKSKPEPEAAPAEDASPAKEDATPAKDAAKDAAAPSEGTAAPAEGTAAPSEGGE